MKTVALMNGQNILKKYIIGFAVVSAAFLVFILALIIAYKVYVGMKTEKYVEALGDKNPAAQNEAITKIGKLKDLRRKANKLSSLVFSDDNGEVVKKLEEFIRIGNDDIRLNLVLVLGKMGGSETIPLLTKALKDKNPEVRLKAIETLGKIKDPAAVPALIKSLEDKNSDVVIHAIWALGNIGDNSSVPALTALLEDKNQYVRYQAYVALKRIKDYQED